jgi:hypothetical protein
MMVDSDKESSSYMFVFCLSTSTIRDNGAAKAVLTTTACWEERQRKHVRGEDSLAGA